MYSLLNAVGGRFFLSKGAIGQEEEALVRQGVNLSRWDSSSSNGDIRAVIETREAAHVVYCMVVSELPKIAFFLDSNPCIITDAAGVL